ncbi:tetraspanin-1-like [Clarias gariepinus]|uniref:tetraspanin-1-like n=1 Tax=Clarias gariepinus TaxID=13013 RepID=UPI00234C5C4F|nr:tetraspanin-1-like [Clarias gariepinus]
MTCTWILKVLMVIINSAILIAGGITAIIGFLIETKGKTVLELLKNNNEIFSDFAPWFNATYSLIAIGAVLAFMGFLGCCGAYCEDKCMLMIYFIIIFAVFVAEVLAAVLLLLHQSKAEVLLNNIRTQVAKNIKENYGKNNIITKPWNETMDLMKCCGYNNYTDFEDSPHVNNTSLYPPSCCSETNECFRKKAESEKVTGCFDALVKWVQNNSSLLGGIAVCIIAIEVVAMIVSLILYRG